MTTNPLSASTNRSISINPHSERGSSSETRPLLNAITKIALMNGTLPNGTSDLIRGAFSLGVVIAPEPYQLVFALAALGIRYADRKAQNPPRTRQDNPENQEHTRQHPRNPPERNPSYTEPPREPATQFSQRRPLPAEFTPREAVGGQRHSPLGQQPDQNRGPATVSSQRESVGKGSCSVQ